MAKFCGNCGAQLGDNETFCGNCGAAVNSEPAANAAEVQSENPAPSQEQPKLISILCKLYKANKQCQAILDVEVCGASAEAPLIESCRKKIHAAFFGRQLSLKNARTVINDFRKASQNKESIADLMLYYVECGVEFTNLYGDIDERFYSSLESMFADFVMILNSMENDSFYRRQSKRIRAVFEDTRNIGWGFSDEIARIYFDICFLT